MERRARCARTSSAHLTRLYVPFARCEIRRVRARSIAATLATLATFGAIDGCHASSTDPAPSAVTCAIAIAAPTSWRLRAEGRSFREAAGRLVLLRGVNAGGRSKFAPFVPFDFAPDGFDAALAAYMDRAAGWGLNVLRVPFVWSAVEPTKGKDDEAFLARYDAILDAAWKRGIRTIIDFHQDLYAENYCGDGFPAWTFPASVTPPAPHHDCPGWGSRYLTDTDVKAAFDRFWADSSSVQADYVALWDRLLARYRDRPGVIGFDPINEPAPGNAESGAFQKTTLRDFYGRMIARLHAAAPEALVFVEPVVFDGGFASTKLERPVGDGVVFAPHYYPLGAMEADVVHNGLEKWAAVAAAWNVPVFIGEFGHTDPDDADVYSFLSWHYDALDDQLMSGTQWEYSVAAEDWNVEGFSLVRADGTERKLVGALLRPYARATAGRDVVTAYDTSARTFTLEYTPDANGITEISLPARAAEKGIDVQLAGGCYDATHPGAVLVRSDATASKVLLRMTLR
jgi:endoglycosylceramidase